MNVENIQEQIPSINIAKIEMSWFMAINAKKSVEFDRTNLIDGSHDNVIQSIAKAIDVMLCSEYEDSLASLSCRHESKDPHNKRQSYVKMHLIGTGDFLLNGEMSSQFHITRYLNKKDVNFVFTSIFENAKQKKLSIQKFHQDLEIVDMLRCLDPFISPDCMPNGVDINQLIVKMIGLKPIATAVKSMQNDYLVNSIKAFELSEINKLFREKFAETKDSIKEIRTLKCALITQKMEKIKQKYPELNELGKIRYQLANDIKQAKLNKMMKVFQFVQDSHCKMFNAKLHAERKAIEDYEKTDDEQRIPRLNEAVDDYCTQCPTFMDQLKAVRASKLDLFENQMATIEWHKVNDMRDPAQIANEMKKNDECIVKVTKILSRSNADRTEEEVKGRIVRGLQAIRDNISAIKKIEDELIGPAQKVFFFNHQKLSSYQQSINHEIKMTIARAELEKFYASDNWLQQPQIDVLRKGHELLSVYSNEFHEQFLGHIGQFIDVNTDFNILRVVLPILSRDYLSAFIFNRKVVANNFIKSFMSSNPGKTILAFGKDEWDGDLEGDAPDGVSLDEKILTPETLQRYPFIGNFFRAFCITAGNKDQNYCQKIAMNGIYKIFNGNWYYDETSKTCVRGAQNINYLKAVVEKWVEMGKNLHSRLDSGYKKCVADKLMNKSEEEMIMFESKLNELRLEIRIRRAKLANILDVRKELIETGDAAVLFRRQLRIKSKVFHMKRDWLKKRYALQSPEHLEPYEPIVQGPYPNCTWPTVVEAALFAAIQKFSNFHANGFSRMVYQSEDFIKFKDWVSNCENIEAPNLGIEPQPNVKTDENIEEQIKVNNALEAAYEKLLCLSKEKSLLIENVDFCVLGSVVELSEKPQEELRRQLDQTEQNLPADVILPGSDIKSITDNLLLFDDVTNVNHADISALTTQRSLEASWNVEPKLVTYFTHLLEILELLNEFYDWQDMVFVLRLSTANDTKIEYIHHENPQMRNWIQKFTVQELCDDDTRLNFYLKSNENDDYIINDNLDIKRNSLATLLHASLSRSMNPSLFILNNTIIGRSSIEVDGIIEKYRPFGDNEATQLILFARSNVDYRELFEHDYKRIECRATNNNRWNIIQTVNQ